MKGSSLTLHSGVVAGLATSFWIVGCGTPSPEAVEAWKRNFAEAIIPGSTDFHGLFVDADNEVFMFGYRPPEDLADADVLLRVRGQLGCREVVSTRTELQLRCPSPRARWPTSFDEYRFLFDPARRLVSVMFVRVDSEYRLAVYDANARILRCVHRPEGMPLFGSCP